MCDSLKEQMKLTKKDRELCLKNIRKQLIRSLHVYEQEKLGQTHYNYKLYIKNLMLFIISFNELFDSELSNIVVKLNVLLINDFEKKDYKSTIFECVNSVDYILNEGVSNGEDN